MIGFGRAEVLTTLPFWRLRWQSWDSRAELGCLSIWVWVFSGSEFGVEFGLSSVFSGSEFSVEFGLNSVFSGFFPKSALVLDRGGCWSNG